MFSGWVDYNKHSSCGFSAETREECRRLAAEYKQHYIDLGYVVNRVWVFQKCTCEGGWVVKRYKSGMVRSRTKCKVCRGLCEIHTEDLP